MALIISSLFFFPPLSNPSFFLIKFIRFLIIFFSLKFTKSTSKSSKSSARVIWSIFSNPFCFYWIVFDDDFCTGPVFSSLAILIFDKIPYFSSSFLRFWNLLNSPLKIRDILDFPLETSYLRLIYFYFFWALTFSFDVVRVKRTH
jgi:hypothetical protein